MKYYRNILDPSSIVYLRNEVEMLTDFQGNYWLGIHDEPENTVEKYIQDSFDFYLSDEYPKVIGFEWWFHIMDSSTQMIALHASHDEHHRMRTAEMICRLSGVDGSKLGGHLSDEEQDKLRDSIGTYATEMPWWLMNRQRDLETNEDAHIVALEVKMTRDDDVARMAGIKTYRGMRHRSGHKVRGQRLRSNGRKGSALGVQRKK